MNTNEFQSIWQEYDAKLDKSLKLNLQVIENIQAQKIKSAYTSVKIFKTVEIIVGVLFMFFFGNFLYTNLTDFYYVVAGGVLMVFCTLAVIGSVSQIVYINRLNYNESLVDNQRKIALLQSSVLLQSSIIKISADCYYKFAFLPSLYYYRM